MKVLVYGAGVIGCFLAHTLCEAGNQVSLLARGEWRRTLEKDGLVIRHSLQRKTTTDHLRIVGEAGGEAYDAVFAVMQHQQMKLVLDDLAEVNAPVIVLVGNNLSAAEMERHILSRSKSPKTVLFGFQGTGGRRQDGKVICIRFGGGSMSIGGLHGEPSGKIKTQVAALFRGMKYRLTWVPDMDAWYRCHAALILPAAFLCYATGCNLRKATRTQRRQLLDAANEAYTLLAKLGYPILPPGEEAYYQPGSKRKLMEAMVFIMAKTVIGDLAASDHCRHAVTEMEGLEEAWRKMRDKKPDFPMPNWDALKRQMPEWEKLHQADTASLKGVPETMLQTLYARASYSQKADHKFYDAKAIEIVSRMDYDFSKAEKDAAMSTGVIARTILLDRMVGEFIKANPDATVVNIACGLDTRFYRMDNGKIRWYNLDLPETIAVRRRFLKEDGRVTTIAKSAMDESWAEEIVKTGERDGGTAAGKTLFIVEGLVMYLEEADVRQILAIIDRHFTQAEIIMETMNPFVVKHMKERSIEATKARFTWGLKSGRELERMAPNLKWVEDVSLVEGMKILYPAYRLIGRIPAVQNISNRLVVLRK